MTNRRDKSVARSRMLTDPDKPAAGNRMQEKQNRMKTEDLTQEIPEWLIAADHKVLTEEGESRNNHRYAVVVQDLAIRWISLIRVTQKLHKKRKNFEKGPRAVTKAKRYLHLQFCWNWANPVKIHLGIIGRQHLIGPRRMALLKERYEE